MKMIGKFLGGRRADLGNLRVLKYNHHPTDLIPRSGTKPQVFLFTFRYDEISLSFTDFEMDKCKRNQETDAREQTQGQRSKVILKLKKS